VSRQPARAHANSDCRIHFVSATEQIALPEAETISLELTCTNRTLCHGLEPGDVRMHTDASPQFADFANLTKPTRSVLPPLAGPAHWGLISHLALNFTSLASVEGLRAALRVYCFHALDQPDVGRALEQRLQAILRLDAVPEERLFGGAPIRGMHSTLHIDETAFANDGELYLFAALLEEFLALYVSLNSFSALTVRGARHGEVYRWNPRLGRQIIL
jgi:type VI secretion system protein ImpG